MVRILYIFIIICVFFIIVSGCSESDESDASPPPQQKTASVAFSIRWHGTGQDRDQSADTATKSAISTNCKDLQIHTVECVVYDDQKNMLKTGLWPCEKGSGEAMSILPGPDRHFVVLGRDVDGAAIYHGVATHTIEPGAVLTLDPIDAYKFGLEDLKEEGIGDTQVDLAWSALDERASVEGYNIYNTANGEEELLTTAPFTVSSFTCDHLMASTGYAIKLCAYDAFGNASRFTDSIIVDTTNRISDTKQQNRCDCPGEDADYTINPPVYEKMDAQGNVLPDSAAEWAMVKDTVSGLIWEAKTDNDNPSDIHNANNGYKWNSAQTNFISQLNAAEFGGSSEWRLPSRTELFSLTTFDKDFNFYDTQVVKMGDPLLHSYWTSTEDISNKDNAIKCNYSDEIKFAVRSWSKDALASAIAVRGKKKSALLEDNKNGTVTDRSTGLTWVQLDHLESSEFPAFFNLANDRLKAMLWHEALAACENLTFAGHNDWRMPNIKELFSLVPDDRHNPAIHTDYFSDLPDIQAYFWSSTDAPSESDIYQIAWTLSFSNNATINLSHSKHPDHNQRLYVRPVR